MLELILLLPCLLVIALVAWARRAEARRQALRQQQAGEPGQES
jgi:hypothetical protein